MFATKGLDLEVVFDDEGAVEALFLFCRAGVEREEEEEGEEGAGQRDEVSGVAPGRTPKMPMRMKNPSSKKCQSLL